LRGALIFVEEKEESRFHIDRGKIFQVEKTPEGFLNCHARVARVGDLIYRNQDGSERIERVSSEVLFKADSYNSLKMKPVTCPEHPPVMLDSENTSKYAKGMTSNIVTIDGSFLGIIMTVTDKQAIDAIEGGIKEVSCGYMATTRPLPDGSFEQISRNYNHLSIVPLGRAGGEVRISMDSQAIPVLQEIVTQNNESDMSDVNKSENTSNLKLDEYESITLPSDIAAKIKSKFNSDAKTVENLKAEMAKLKEAYNTLKEQHDDMVKAEKAEAKEDAIKCDRCDAISKILTDKKYDSFDALLARFDAQTEQLEKAKTDAVDINVNALVKQRVALERKCEGLIPADFKVDEANDRQLMEAVIIRNTKLSKCDGLSDEYIKARFDSVIEISENKDTSEITRKAANESGANGRNDSVRGEKSIENLKLDALNAQKEYLETLQKRS
jgi:hypothetical protein